MKKNKKGFTLIELLAVIAILAILIVIAVPAILDLFNSSRKNAFVTQARRIYQAAEQQLILDQMEGGAPTGYCNLPLGSESSSETALDLEGNQEVKYKVVISNSVITGFYVRSGNYAYCVPTTSNSGLNVGDINDSNSSCKVLKKCSDSIEEVSTQG